MRSYTITKQQIKMLLVIVLVAMSGLMGIDIHIPSLPHIMRDMNTNQQHMQLSIALYILGLALSLLVYGPLSDKHGRKPIVVFGMSVAIVSSFAAAFTHDIVTFLVLRFLQGAGAGVCSGLGRTMAADVLSPEALVDIGSYFSMVVSFSPLFAPAVGAYIQHYFGWQANFIFLSGFLFLVLLLYIFLCPETNQHKNSQASLWRDVFPNYFGFLRHRAFVAATLLTGIAAAANITYATLSAFMLQEQFHVSVINYGWLSSAVAFGVIVGKLAKPSLSRRLGIASTMLAGVLMILVAGLWLLLGRTFGIINVPLIMIAVFITLIGQPFIVSNALYFALSPFHDKRGTAGALFGSFNMLLTFVVSGVVSLFSHEGVILLGSTYFALGIIGMFIYFVVLPKADSRR